MSSRIFKMTQEWPQLALVGQALSESSSRVPGSTGEGGILNKTWRRYKETQEMSTWRGSQMLQSHWAVQLHHKLHFLLQMCFTHSSQTLNSSSLLCHTIRARLLLSNCAPHLSPKRIWDKSPRNGCSCLLSGERSTAGWPSVEASSHLLWEHLEEGDRVFRMSCCCGTRAKRQKPLQQHLQKSRIVEKFWLEGT